MKEIAQYLIADNASAQNAAMKLFDPTFIFGGAEIAGGGDREFKYNITGTTYGSIVHVAIQTHDNTYGDPLGSLFVLEADAAGLTKETFADWMANNIGGYWSVVDEGDQTYLVGQNGYNVIDWGALDITEVGGE